MMAHVDKIGGDLPGKGNRSARKCRGRLSLFQKPVNCIAQPTPVAEIEGAAVLFRLDIEKGVQPLDIAGPMGAAAEQQSARAWGPKCWLFPGRSPAAG